jgi:hypothetical protein
MSQLDHVNCYLCGEALSEPINRDHVPPSMFFAPELRKQFNISELLTLPTHSACNARWKLDEEYFVHTLLPLARGSISGDALWRNCMVRFKRGTNVPLANQVLKEFEHAVNGIILPANRVAKRIDPQRAHDVIYKIVRGLHYHRSGEILPPVWDCHFTITPVGEPLPKVFTFLTSNNLLEQEGRYRGVFAYGGRTFKEVDNLHVWALLLWDRILVTLMFHDPACPCAECTFIGPVRDTGPADRLSR